MAAPVIISPLTAKAAVNFAFRYTIHATNFPTSYNATSLPAQLGINVTTGQITGKIRAAGVYTVHLSAINADGTGTADLVITCTDQGGGGGGQSGPVSVFQAKYRSDDTELLDLSDLDQAGQPVVGFNVGGVGATQLATTAIADKMALIGGPGRVLQFVLGAALVTPIQVRYTVKIGQLDVPQAKPADYIMMGVPLDADGAYIGIAVPGIRNMIFFGVAGANSISFYAWNGQGTTLPAGMKLNFRLFSNASA